MCLFQKSCTNIFQDGSPKAKQICDGLPAWPVNDSRFPISKMSASSLSHHLLSVFQAQVPNPYRHVLVENESDIRPCRAGFKRNQRQPIMKHYLITFTSMCNRNKGCSILMQLLFFFFFIAALSFSFTVLFKSQLVFHSWSLNFHRRLSSLVSMKNNLCNIWLVLRLMQTDYYLL